MWVILLSLFVFAEGAAAEVDCDQFRYNQCRWPQLLREVPREVAVFNAQCPDTVAYIQCIAEYDSTCGEKVHERLEDPESYAKILQVFNEICKDGTELNEVATSNLKCFNDTFSSNKCWHEKRAFIASFVENTAWDRIRCPSEFVFHNCIVQDIYRNCGFRARSATLEFLHRTTFLKHSCPPEKQAEFLEDIDKFDLTEEQKTFAISELEVLRVSRIKLE